MKKAREHIRIICGEDIETIRKAYFNNELQKLLDKIQANPNFSEEEVVELSEYLQELKDERERVSAVIKDKIGELDLNLETKISPPTVDELASGITDEEWREKADSARQFISNKLDEIRQGFKNKTRFETGFWSEISVIFISMSEILEKDLVYKEQLLKSRLTYIIDKYQVSRKEAEERATLTKEFFEYKTLQKMLERLEEFYTFARRYDDKQNNR